MRLYIVFIESAVFEAARCHRLVERVVKYSGLVLLVCDDFPGGDGAKRLPLFFLLIHLGLNELLVGEDCLEIELLVNVGLDKTMLTILVAT